MSEEALDDIITGNDVNQGSDDNHGFKEEIEYAGFWIRFGAAIIDSLVMIPLIALSFYNLFSLKSVVLLYIITLISGLYKPLLEWRFGATVGKMAVKIKVVNIDLKPISIDQAFGRYMPWAISLIITLITSTSMYQAEGFKNIDTYMELTTASQGSSLETISMIYNLIFMIIVGSLVFDSKKRGFHDKIAKTFCVKTNK